MAEEDRVEEYELLLARHLPFYEALRTGSRHPKTSAQRQFQDVARGKVDPTTDHEKAYFYYLKKMGRLLPSSLEQGGVDKYPPGCRPIPSEVATKWDDASENMSGYKSHWN